MIALAVISLAACNRVGYKKTKSGLLYKIVPGNGKDSLIKPGQIAKFHFTTKLNDSVLFTSYDKMPGYYEVPAQNGPSYNMLEVIPLMRSGDSAVVVAVADSLIAHGMNIPGNPKKGSRVTTTLRITHVYSDQEMARADFNKEVENDRPRAMKAQAEERKQMLQAYREQQAKEEDELEKSGELAKQLGVVQSYLSARNISAQQSGKGTFVAIAEPGTGQQAADDKYVTIKYTGKFLRNDSTFDAGSFEKPLGQGELIQGIEDGIKAFKEGGKGTIFIAGFRAYGKNARPGWNPYEALKFEVEVQKVADQPTAQ